MHLAIGGPTRDTVPASFVTDFAHLFAYTRERGPWPTVTDLFLCHTYIHCGRELVLEAALKQGATHLLWLDSDMSFPRTTAVQLWMHQQAIVACNYLSRRQASGRWTAQRDDGTRIETHERSSGLEAVDIAGMGVFFLSTDVVADLARPWFRHGLNEFGGDVGEDVLFCRALRAAGHTIYLDHDLSKEIGHIGQHTYRAAYETAVTL